MALTVEEKKQHQREAQKRYRSNRKLKTGYYACESQMIAQRNYINKKREQEGKSPVKPRNKRNKPRQTIESDEEIFYGC